jgi:hypothetical protein
MIGSQSGSRAGLPCTSKVQQREILFIRPTDCTRFVILLHKVCHPEPVRMFFCAPK